MTAIENEVIKHIVRQGLEEIVKTENCTLEEAYRIGFEDALKLIKNVYGLK